ncbi:MAG TPA: Ig domain-containing protein [Candidatus Limnocylindrales bacterium]
MHAKAFLTVGTLGRVRRHLAGVSGTIAVAVLLVAVLGCTPRSALQFSPLALPDAQVGSSYAATITVAQAATPVGGVSVQDGALPAGMTLALADAPDNTIQISGTPTSAGTFSFTVYVWCYGTNVSGQTATQAYSLVVK